MRSKDNEEEIIILQLLIKLKSIDQNYMEKLCVHAIKDCNNAYAKRKPNQSFTDILLCFSST